MISIYIYTKLAYHHLFWPKLVKSMAWVWLSRVLTIMLVSIVYIYIHICIIRYAIGLVDGENPWENLKSRTGEVQPAELNLYGDFPLDATLDPEGHSSGGSCRSPFWVSVLAGNRWILQKKRLRSKNWETDLTHGFRSKLSQLLKLIHRFPKALNVRKKHSKHRISASKHIRK